MLMMALVPPITAIIGWAALGNAVRPRHCRHSRNGKRDSNGGAEKDGASGRLAFSHSVTGILLALGGALGQAGGLILSKYGMGDYDPFASTQIRVIAGTAGFAALFSVMRLWGRVSAGIKNGGALSRIALGAMFGPFLGVSFSLYAVQRTATGIASTIMGIVPVLIIVPAVLCSAKRSPSARSRARFAVTGVALFFS